MTAILEAQKQRVARQGIDIEKLKHHMAVATAKLECRKEGTRLTALSAAMAKRKYLSGHLILARAN